LDFWGFRFS